MRTSAAAPPASAASATSAAASLRSAGPAPYPRAVTAERAHMSSPVIALEDVGLTLTGNAGPVKILRGVHLRVAAARPWAWSVRPGRASRRS